jgi:4-diphosphocytidyl-2C-methyl-D-erythritol kinase
MDISPRLSSVMLPLISADDLASLFQTVSLSDELCFSRLPSSDETIAADEMTCSDSSLLVDSGNLVIKALNLMRVKTNIKQYFRVHLDKIVPMQGKSLCIDATDCVISYS